MALLEERKKKFKSEGLFDESYKKDIPFFPQTIGIIILWLSAFLTLYTGYDYLRKGIDHAISEDNKD